MSKPSWIITKDYINLIDSEVGTYGPRNCSYTVAELIVLAKNKFRMYDDDGELYYEGFCTEEDFAPLDDFGTPNAGCTRIDFLNKDGEWRML